MYRIIVWITIIREYYILPEIMFDFFSTRCFYFILLILIVKDNVYNLMVQRGRTQLLKLEVDGSNLILTLHKSLLYVLE